MSGLIPESFIDALVERVDIVEIIERRVPLKRAGREYQARCPFHEEKTPSFTVSPQKQFYHCFGCGAHGTAIGFLMQYDGLEFVDAVEELARTVGLEVPREGGGEARRVDQSLYEVMESAAAFYAQQLKQAPEAVAYLKQRGVSGEIAKHFRMGYAPPEWDRLARHLRAPSVGASKEQLMQTGLASEGKHGPIDKFRDRIMFPITDQRGRVIAFGGRALADDGPKYLNSPETELFHKGREVYGLSWARRQQGRLERLVVVEGYMDVVALAQAGIPETVATLGTAVTAFQVERLFRTAPDVIFCFDGDRAGRQAAWRALEAALSQLREGRQAKFLFLPEGEDPDSMVRAEGLAAFQDRLSAALPLSEYLFQHLSEDLDLAILDDRARLVERVEPLLQRMPEGVFRDLLAAELERRSGYAPARPATVAAPLRRSPPAAGGRANSPVRLALRHLLADPGLALEVDNGEALASVDIPGVALLHAVIDFCRHRPNMTTAGLIEHFRAHPSGTHLGRLAADLPAVEAETARRELEDCLIRIRIDALQARHGTLERRKAQGESLSDDEVAELRSLLPKIGTLKDQLKI